VNIEKSLLALNIQSEVFPLFRLRSMVFESFGILWIPLHLFSNEAFSKVNKLSIMKQPLIEWCLHICELIPCKPFILSKDLLGMLELLPVEPSMHIE
jgi:hypothetical protein